MLGRETERRPLFCSLCPLHIAWAERHACALNGVRKKGRAKERSEGELCEWLGGKGRVHSWSCTMLSDRKREERSKMWAPDTRGEAWSCQEWHIVWKRRGGSFPHFQLALSILPHLPAPNHPAHQPPPPLSVLAKDACGLLTLSLSLCLPGGERGWLVAAGPLGDRLWVFTLRRCRLCGPGLVTLGLFSTETGLSLLRFRPLLCFLWHWRLPHTGLCLLGSWCCGTTLHLGLNYCDTWRTVPLKVHLLPKCMHHSRNARVCVM